MQNSLHRRRKGVYESSSSRRKKPPVTFSGNSWKFGKSCVDLSWNHRTSTPRRSETNGIAERAARRVKEGTSAVLLQSRLDERWWAGSMECYYYLLNVQDLLEDGKTPHERRFEEPFKGPIIPIGSKVEYHLTSTRDLSRLHQFGKKVLLGIFLGYELIAGGILEKRCSDCGFGRFGKVGRVRNLSSKKRERRIHNTKRK